MSSADVEYKNIIINILSSGAMRETRSGVVKSTFAPREFRFDMSEGAPLLTGKQIFTQQMIGELLWFIGGDHSIHQLQKRTWGIYNEKNTIWTPDQQRWHDSLSPDVQARLKYVDDCGRLYGRQWRNSAGKFGCEVDQLEKLIHTIRHNPESRYQLLNSWNAAEIDANMMALPPCHVLFQTYVTNDNRLSLKWYQRSVDAFLGLPFNIASYGLLLSILAKICGLGEGELIGTFGDAHIYQNHFDAVSQYMKNETFDAPKLVLPEMKSLLDVEGMTALDFKGCYKDYNHAGQIKAPLSVG